MFNIWLLYCACFCHYKRNTLWMSYYIKMVCECRTKYDPWISHQISGETACPCVCKANLQCTALCCTDVYFVSRTVTQYLLHCVVLYCVALCCAVLYCIVLCCTVLYCIALYCTVLCCTVLRCNILCCTALHCTVLYCTALHCIALHCVCVCARMCLRVCVRPLFERGVMRFN